MSRKSCIGCRHYRCLFGAQQWRESKSAKGCHYLLDTGEPRGCPAAHCTRYDPHEETEEEATIRKLRAIEDGEHINYSLKITTAGGGT